MQKSKRYKTFLSVFVYPVVTANYFKGRIWPKTTNSFGSNVHFLSLYKDKSVLSLVNKLVPSIVRCLGVSLCPSIAFLPIQCQDKENSIIFWRMCKYDQIRFIIRIRVIYVRIVSMIYYGSIVTTLFGCNKLFTSFPYSLVFSFSNVVSLFFSFDWNNIID